MTISLTLTTFAVVILVLHQPALEDMAAVSADPQADVTHLGGDLFHSVGGLGILLVPLVLNIFKPRGMTRHGWVRTQELRVKASRA